MRAHCFYHVPFEGLGSIQTWLETRACEISSTRFYAGDGLPERDAVDLLIVMGGPMSVNDTEEFPWLVQEKEFIRAMIAAGKPVLGVCLGAQLIANAMGAPVYRNPVKEIGWFPIQAMPMCEPETFQFPREMDVFHWHGETFDLPDGARHLARSEGCQNQAFQWGRSVIGLQFHLEMTPASVETIIEHCRNEIIPAKYIQAEAAMLAVAPDTLRAVNEQMNRVLDFITGRCD